MFSNLKEIDQTNAMVTQNSISKAVRQNLSAFYKVKTQTFSVKPVTEF